MTLETLAQALREQATNSGSITLNPDILPQAEADAVSAAFLLGQGHYLTVNNVTPGDIPDPQGSALQVSAGSASLLKQSNVTPHITFTVDEQGAVQCVIAAGMPAGWGFTSTFPSLVVFPFDDLTPSETYFVYSSLPQDAFYPWADKPQEGIALAPGLNFASWMTLDIFSGAVAVLEEVFDAATAYKFSGPFSPDESNPYPVTTLTLKLSDETFEITDDLSVGNLSLIVEVTPPADSLQQISLSLAAFTTDLEFSVGISGSDPSLIFTAAPIPGHQFTAEQIMALPAGSDFQSYIPEELNDAFKTVGLDYFTITLAAGKAVGFVGFSISTVPGFTWTLITDVLTLEYITLELSYSDPFGPAKLATVYLGAECRLFPSVFPDMFDFVLELDNAGAGNKWEIGVISGEYIGSVQLGALVAAVVGNTSNVPSALNQISFSNFGAAATKVGDGYTYNLHGRADAAFPMLDTELISSLTVVADYAKTGYKVDLKGALGIGQENFALELKLSETSGAQTGQQAGATSSIVLYASWAVTGTQYLQFEDIAAAFGFSDAPAIPEGLDLSLKSAALTYNFTKNELAIGFQSATYGNADFVALKVGAASEYFFGLGVPHPIVLSDLPLVKDVIGPEDTVQITNLQVVISSTTIKSSDAATIKAVTDLVNSLGAGYPNIPADGIAAGVALSMTFSAGAFQAPLSLSTATSTQQGGAAGGGDGGAAGGGSTPPATGSTDVPATTSSDGTVWYNLQKTFGPISFQKVGIRYRDSVLFVLMNASLSAGGLTISVLGLGVGSPLKSFEPSFNIDGVAISFAEGPVTISGGLLGTLDPLNFYGELTLGFPEVTISALGGYAEADGHPSFFLYAVLDYPIGGPSFFFVTGLAAGFGYNRSLVVPDVSGVATFPLVQWAVGAGSPPGMNTGGDIAAQVSGVLTRLSQSGVVAPSVGEYWAALGIRFTSFELLDSFALLTISFGTSFEVDLLGLSRLIVPPAPAPAVASVELELKASFSPDQGLLAVQGQLTPKSYVFDPACHLTGGFAFYTWFGDHAGEFVVTLGGYSPRFTPPSYYPQVPRLGLNWQVVPGELTIQGDLYFALTSSAVMAGGGMSAVWQSGDIRAWFDVEADFLMLFSPFHYYISASIHLGASFRLNLLFTHVTVTIHVGVGIEIWGPDFAGEATVDLDIISFTISFGASGQSTQTTIKWGEFVDQLMPKASSSAPPAAATPATRAAMSAALAAADPTAPPSVIQLKISNGLLKTLSTQPGQLNYVVSGEQFELTTQTAIPATAPSFSSNIKLVTDGQPTPNTNIAVGPTGTAAGSFTSTHAITIEGTEKAQQFHAVAVLGNVPKALWELRSYDEHGVPVGVDPVNDTTVPNAIVGYKVTGYAPPPEQTPLPIPIANLRYDLDPKLQQFSWSDAYFPTADAFTDETVTSTIGVAPAESNRPLLLAAIVNADLSIPTQVDLDGLTDPSANYLLAEPALSLLGEQKSTE